MSRHESENVPDFVPHACRCTICDAPADRHFNVFYCRSVPGHMADTLTGIFSDCSDPTEDEKKENHEG